MKVLLFVIALASGLSAWAGETDTECSAMNGNVTKAVKSDSTKEKTSGQAVRQ